MEAMLAQLTTALEPTRQRLLNHPVYATVCDLDGLRDLTTYHAFAVWDFMSLLKALQRNLTSVAVPWVPVGAGSTRYLINEIVTGEESDEAPEWLGLTDSHISHYELYRIAMQQLGADTDPIDQFLAKLAAGLSVQQALRETDVPEGVRQFVQFTFDVIATEKPHILASVFTFGREDLIPDMFLNLVRSLDADAPDQLRTFRYYLERHIEVDGDHHSHLAMQMVMALCANDATRWQEATDWAIQSMEARIGLWDAVCERVAVAN
ncbi:DUF3050 domain-containing protein [Fibrella forsythiae]|uniref:DUF3050 domain-containing protein n=1 Tax=Fibrella forsythiae TaxID=2817061 RepID=A0ABS3JFZ2_9BACT|nr:DUF3050 domain-containing protein [Fibrella forsythiae]MBO0948919.1 DUF3050 domain-containing protein [Fibrella forsythiae]